MILRGRLPGYLVLSVPEKLQPPVILNLKQYVMADLHVQPKRKNNLWVWLIIFILIVGAIAYYFGVYKKDHPGDQAFLQSPAYKVQTLQNNLV